MAGRCPGVPPTPSATYTDFVDLWRTDEMDITSASPKTMSPVASCPVCGGSGGITLKSATVAEVETRVVRCEGCGLVHAIPRHAQDFRRVPLAFYQNDWASFDPNMVTFQFNRLLDAIRVQSPKLLNEPHKATLLDIGCGPGYLMAHARAHGWNVKGVDPWAELAAWGRKHLKLDIAASTWEEVRIDPARVDIIAVFDVLPFISEPVPFLAKCFAALKESGIIHISAWNHSVDDDDASSFVIGAHQAAYTSVSLVRAFRAAGFRARDINLTTGGGTGGGQEMVVTARRAIEPKVTWDDIADEVDDRLKPFLDRHTIPVATLNPRQAFWRENGYLILEKFIPDEIVDRYVAVRERIKDPLGWHSPNAYEEVEEMRDLALYAPLAEIMEQLIGKTLGLHLVLSGWRSTTRDWHQDDYLNPPEVNSHYMAAWFALDSISPDSGPFEFVPGSHRWPLVRRSKIMAQLPSGAALDDSWPWLSEEILSPFFDAEIDRRNAEVRQFLGKKGDVLLWHSNLLHRGSLPRNPYIERRSLIAHFTAVGHRNDMHATQRHKGGGTYFDLKADRRPDRGEKQEESGPWGTNLLKVPRLWPR